MPCRRLSSSSERSSFHRSVHVPQSCVCTYVFPCGKLCCRFLDDGLTALERLTERADNDTVGYARFTDDVYFHTSTTPAVQRYSASVRFKQAASTHTAQILNTTCIILLSRDGEVLLTHADAGPALCARTAQYGSAGTDVPNHPAELHTARHAILCCRCWPVTSLAPPRNQASQQ